MSRGTLESIALLVDRRARLQICCDQAGLLPRLFRLGMPDHRDGDLLIVQSSTTIMRRSAAGRVRATVRATGDLRPRVLHDRQDRLHLSGLIDGTDATSALITRPSVALPTLGFSAASSDEPRIDRSNISECLHREGHSSVTG